MINNRVIIRKLKELFVIVYLEDEFVIFRIEKPEHRDMLIRLINSCEDYSEVAAIIDLLTRFNVVDSHLQLCWKAIKPLVVAEGYIIEFANLLRSHPTFVWSYDI